MSWPGPAHDAVCVKTKRTISKSEFLEIIFSSKISLVDTDNTRAGRRKEGR
jgi:hypothetical protein